jgi:hypothetical protein
MRHAEDIRETSRIPPLHLLKLYVTSDRRGPLHRSTTSDENKPAQWYFISRNGEQIILSILIKPAPPRRTDFNA